MKAKAATFSIVSVGRYLAPMVPITTASSVAAAKPMTAETKIVSGVFSFADKASTAS